MGPGWGFGRSSYPENVGQSGARGVDARVLRVGLIVQRAGAEREGGTGRAYTVREALETKAVTKAAGCIHLVLRPVARVVVDTRSATQPRLSPLPRRRGKGERRGWGAVGAQPRAPPPAKTVLHGRTSLALFNITIS